MTELHTTDSMPQLPPGERFLRLREVALLVGLSKTEIYRQIASGTFPVGRRYPFNAARKFWLQSEIDRWMIAALHP